MLFILTVLSLIIFSATLLITTTLINTEKFSKKLSQYTETEVGKIFSNLLREGENE